MTRRSLFLAILTVFALVPLQAATVSKQNADRFARKLVVIQQQGESKEGVGARRTALTEDEVNSWFAYAAQPLLPPGVTQPQVTAVGQGKLIAQAIVDLAAMGRSRSSGGALDPFGLLGGKLPLNVTGILHARDGVGRFELQAAYIAGVAVSPAIVQELLTYYSRTPDRPQGVRLDAPFALPANIRQIDVGQGQAVVVQ
jgi:hypothetical protein